MVAKRALVVDDSRSARAFLTKLLEEQQIEVDAAETAEQAIDYLVNGRPDVIFMDHLMPGMDGFQALQAIKANPRTSGIPVLMYTSQEGELYLGQALALGAVGVVQKNMAPGDVRTLLQQLALVPGATAIAALPPETSAAQLQSPEAEEADVTKVEVSTAATGPLAMELLKEDVATLRRELADGLKGHSDHIMREVRNVGRALPLQAAAPMAMIPEKPRHSPGPWLLAVAACMAAAVLGTLLWNNEQLLTAARTELMDSKATVALLTARLAPAPVDAIVVAVPFAEAPLAAGRIDALRDFVGRIAVPGRPGTVEVRYYPGRFCLAGSAAAGHVLADDALSASKCLVTEANDPVLGNTAAQSPAFTSALDALRKQHAMITIDVSVGQGEAPGRRYPAMDDPAHSPTAGEWNAVAAASNRVEIRWHPAP